MKKLWFIFVIMLIISNSIYSMTKNDYEKKFKEVETLIQKQNPKSALKIIEELKIEAKKENNKEQYLKSLILSIKTESILNEFTSEKRINLLFKEIQNSDFPENAILQSITAKVLWSYYNINRFKFAGRNETKEFIKDDISTWSLGEIIEECSSLYKNSISNVNELQKININSYSSLVIKGNDSNIKTTLFDILADNALQFFINNEAGVAEPFYAFNIDKTEFFLPSEDFVKYNVESKDTTSMKFNAIKIFQIMEKKYLLSSNKPALYDINLKRIKFCYQNSIIDNKNELYEKSLKTLLSLAKSTETESECAYELSNFYYNCAYNNNITKDEQKSFIKNAISLAEQYSKYSDIGGNNCKSLIERINQKSLSLNIKNCNIPDEPINFSMEYKNINKVYFKVIAFSPDEIFDDDYYLSSEKVQKLKSLTPIKSWEVSFQNADDKLSHTKELILDKLPSGNYIIFCATNKDFSNTYGDGFSYGVFSVNSISYIYKNINNNKIEVYAADRKSGKPLKGVSVSLWSFSYDYSQNKRKILRKLISNKIVTGSNGFASLKTDENIRSNNYIKFESKGEIVYSSQFYNNFYNENNITTYMNIFTDRAIYRPGQTVYFKGILINSDGINTNIVPNSNSEISFYDVNGSLINKVSLITNEFGSISGSFTIPKNLINGVMRIESNKNGAVQINVEEYKRPKFEVTISGSDKEYRVNDNVIISGKAISYSGVPVNNASVKYSIKRKALFPEWFYFWYPSISSQEVTMTFGTTTTDNKGVFNINFNALPDKTLNKENNTYFRYEISVDVTDTNGETRSNSSIINAGYCATKLTINGQEAYDQETPGTFNIFSENLNNKKINTDIKIKIFKLDDNSINLQKRDFDKEKEIFSTNFNTSKVENINIDFSKYSTGKYVLTAESIDSFGEKSTALKEFTIYSLKSDEMPFKSINWFFIPSASSEPGKDIQIIFGSSDEVWAIIEKESRNSIVDRNFIHLKNKQQIINIPVNESDRGNFTIRVSFIKNNKFYNNEANINVPWTNKLLNIKYETFRDKLLPGTNEEYRLILSSNSKEKISAEIAASMYDSSLDYFVQHSWKQNFYKNYYSKLNWNEGNQFNNIYFTNIFNWYPKISLLERQYTTINDYNISNLYENFRLKKYNTMLMVKAEAPLAVAEEKDSVNLDSGFIDKNITGQNKTNISENVNIRKNLNETLFFYPNLKNDDNGNFTISFKSGETLTKWKMMIFAHTKDMKYGIFEKEITTSKDIMVTPNIPRFLREKDSITFSSKVSNTTDKKITGKVKLEIFDAETMKLINNSFNLENDTLDFSIEALSSSSFSWKTIIPENISAAIIRVTAYSDSISDGEEVMVPILTDKMIVTDTLAMSVNADTKKEFLFKNLLNQSTTQKPYKLSFEWSSNPAWYAVQSLPYIAEYPYECSEQLFSRLYANSVSSLIIDKNPEIKRIYSMWQNKGDSLSSNLEKNQELKQILLEESPWVIDAKSEDEQKNKISQLFDLNRINNEKESVIQKLENRQYKNGGFPWFEGMEPNFYITAHITAGFGKMRKMGINEDPRITSIIKKAISFLDYQTNERYKLIKNKKEYHISNIDLFYLYTRSFYLDYSIVPEYKESYNYFIKQAETYWTDLNKYMQAMTALSLFRAGNQKTALDIINSLEENAMESEELGMWWKSEDTNFYWYNAKIEKQAMMIEAFTEIKNNPKNIDAMKLWLLKNKQTNKWETTKATVEAIYALLMNNNNFLTEDKISEIKLNNKPFNEIFGKIENKEAGTGYFKSILNSNEIKPEYGNISIKNNSNSAQWGAVYYQYFENLENIGTSSSGINITKKLFIEKDGDNGKYIIPVNDKNSIKIGDKIIVRIEIKNDRDLEFVHLKDMRGAGFEPINVISNYKYQDNLGYYEETKDSSQNFFFDYIPKGTHIFEYPIVAFNSGDFSAGITTIQCMYAPEFSSHSEGIRVKIEP